MPIKINNFDRFRRQVEAEQKRRVTRAAIDVSRHARELLSVSGTGTRTKAGVVRAIKTGRGRVYGAFPSAPGEPPRKQTGDLRRSVAWELVDNGTARVGTNRPKGKFLELGTSRMKPRPWLERSLRERLTAIRATLTAPLNIP